MTTKVKKALPWAVILALSAGAVVATAGLPGKLRGQGAAGGQGLTAAPNGRFAPATHEPGSEGWWAERMHPHCAWGIFEVAEQGNVGGLNFVIDAAAWIGSKSDLPGAMVAGVQVFDPADLQMRGMPIAGDVSRPFGIARGTLTRFQVPYEQVLPPDTYPVRVTLTCARDEGASLMTHNLHLTVQ